MANEFIRRASVRHPSEKEENAKRCVMARVTWKAKTRSLWMLFSAALERLFSGCDEPKIVSALMVAVRPTDRRKQIRHVMKVCM